MNDEEIDASFRSRSEKGIWKVRGKHAESLVIASVSLKNFFAVKSSRLPKGVWLARRKHVESVVN